MRNGTAGSGVRVVGVLAASASLLAGCANFAPPRLYQDQIGYSEALGSSEKAQTLLNVVRLRYGDIPVFLKTTQVISGYSLQQNLGGSFTPGVSTGGIVGTPGVAVTQTPTFTFQPVSGDALAQSYVRPLAPAELIPLSLGGIPVDVLFRLAVQSVNGLRNSSPLDGSNRSDSPGFARLLINLRQLQTAGLLGVRLDRKAGDDPKAKPGRLLLSIAATSDPALRAVAVETRRLLGMAPAAAEAEVVYGLDAFEPGKIAIITRSVLGMLAYVASEIQVAQGDVADGATIRTVDYADIFRRPAVIVRSGDQPSAGAFSNVRYRNRWYWIENGDFDSKIAFSVIQLLMSLAETPQSAGPVVTIPAR